MDLDRFCIDLYGFVLIYMNLYEFIQIHADLYAFSCIFTCFLCVYELGAAYKRAAGAFSRQKTRPWIFGLCEFWKLSELSEFQYVWILGPV